MLAKPDVVRALDRLATVYRVPEGTNLAVLGDVWFRALQGIQARELGDAVDAYLRSTARYFPKPGEIRKLALSLRTNPLEDTSLLGRWQKWQFGSGLGDGEPCPVCAAVLGEMPNGRLNVSHDHQEHYTRNIPYAGPRTGPVDAQGRMMPVQYGEEP